MSPLTLRRARGFTLLEVLVGAAISLVAIGAVTATFLSQQRSLQALDLQRTLAEAGRDAQIEMESALRRAGYGIDPRYVFDFTKYNCTSGSGCRDSVTGADQIVFVSRNPDYTFTPGCGTGASCLTGNAFPVSNAPAPSATSITVTLPNGFVLHKGRVVQISCASPSTQTMATVASTVTGNGAPLAVSLVAAVAGNPYLENAFTPACFSQTGVAMFLVDRYHYLIQNYGGVPWLVLDNGLDLNGNGTTPENGNDIGDYIPIAPGVEDLQIAYVLNINAPNSTSGGVSAAPGPGPDKPAGSGNWVIGDAYTGTGAGITGTVEEPDPTYSNMPTYSTPPRNALRFNNSAANIRGVRINLSLRSQQTDQTKPSSWTGDAELRTENLNASAAASGGRYRRFLFSSTVACRDMEARAPFIF